LYSSIAAPRKIKVYAKKTGITHARCWAHCRRKFFEARNIEPERAEQALQMIGALYAIEAKIREQRLTGLPIGITRKARSSWLASMATSGSFRYTSSPSRRSRAYASAAVSGLLGKSPWRSNC
jgi:hypothetical protein